MKKQFILAKQFHRQCFHLAHKIYMSEYVPDVVLGIWRGGSYPAIVIHEYYIYRGHVHVKSEVLTARSYVGIGMQLDTVDLDLSEKVLQTLRNAKQILVVDDVVDSGKTIGQILQYFREHHVTAAVKVASVYFKPRTSSVVPDYTVEETDQWIVFPHELEGLLPEEVHQKGLELLC